MYTIQDAGIVQPDASALPQRDQNTTLCYAVRHVSFNTPALNVSSLHKRTTIPRLRASHSTTSHLLERISDLVVLPHMMLPPLLRRHVLDQHLLPVLPHEPLDISRVPQLARDAQVLAAAHERVGFAAFRRRRDAIGVEVLLFAARY